MSLVLVYSNDQMTMIDISDLCDNMLPFDLIFIRWRVHQLGVAEVTEVMICDFTVSRGDT